MPAFVVNNNHIHAMLTSVQSGDWNYKLWPEVHRGEIKTLSEIGQVLVDQNYASVNYRYNETDTPPRYTFKPYPKPLSPVQIIKACNCYDYQACETSDYEQSIAYRFVQRIRDNAINMLPGYSDAAWEIS